MTVKKSAIQEIQNQFYFNPDYMFKNPVVKERCNNGLERRVL